MKAPRHVAAAWLILWVCLADLPSPAATDNWFKLVTPNFELISDGRESEAKKLLSKLEHFRHVVSRFLALTNEQPRPVTVFYFRDGKSFARFKPLYQGRPAGMDGLHARDPSGSVLALQRQAETSGTMEVIFHEYIHLLTARQFRDAPLWLHEGVAEAFSTFEMDANVYHIGRAKLNHAQLLQTTLPVMPLERLLTVTRESPDYNETSRAGQFYSTSWLLGHYLLFAQRGFQSNVVAQYARLSAVLTNRTDAFRRAFGATPPELGARLTTYLRGGNYTVVRQTYRELEFERAQEVPLPEGELEFQLGNLLRLVERLGEAEARLSGASRLLPTDPRPREAQAFLAYKRGDYARAAAQLQEAFRLGSTNAYAYHLAADLRFRQAARSNPSDPATIDILVAGRKLCERSIELEPEFAPAHQLLGAYRLRENPRAPALAAPHIRKAIQLDPLFKPSYLTWAAVLAAQGNVDAARQQLAVLLASPLAPELKDTALRLSQAIERQVNPTPPK